MRFFTFDWWRASCPDAEATFQRYEGYIETVKDCIPHALLKVHTEEDLHDCVVDRVRLDLSNRKLEITLRGLDIYSLHFEQVNHFDQNFAYTADLQERGWWELVLVGYWEIEIIESWVEVQLLFSSGTLFRISFKEFGYSKISNPDATPLCYP